VVITGVSEAPQWFAWLQRPPTAVSQSRKLGEVAGKKGVGGSSNKTTTKEIVVSPKTSTNLEAAMEFRVKVLRSCWKEGG